MRGGGGGAATPTFSLSAHLPNIFIVALLLKLKAGPIYRQIGLERSLFVLKLRLYTSPTISFKCVVEAVELLQLARGRASFNTVTSGVKIIDYLVFIHYSNIP